MLTHRRMTHCWARTCLFGVVLAALLAGLMAAAAPASQLSDSRRQAARVMAQLDLLQTRRAAALASEQSALQRLGDARARLAASRVEIAAATRSLQASQSALAASLVSSYKNGAADAVAYVLAAGSFTDLVDRVDLLRRSQRSDHDLIVQIGADRSRLEQQRREQRQAAAAAAAAVADARGARRRLDAEIARGGALLARTGSRIRTLLTRERDRRSALAQGDGGAGGGAGAGGSGTGSGGGGGGSGGSSADVFYGECTWYGPGFAGRRTASGEIFDPEKLTAASPWLPFGTQLRVTSTVTGLSVQVRVNDRGPFGRGVLDLSAHAARIIHLSGWQRVRIEILSGSPSAAAVMP
jgi:peptidoglycan hydrolase CwlO-like protein